jgi:hypothetical protein
MSALAVAYVSSAGATPASTRSREEPTSPRDQRFEQPLFTNAKSAEPENSQILVSETGANWLQLLNIARLTRLNWRTGSNIFVSHHSYGQICNSGSGIGLWAYTKTGTNTDLIQLPHAAGYYEDWLEPEIVDHNRVRPKRRFILSLELNFRGRPKALPIDDLE